MPVILLVSFIAISLITSYCKFGNIRENFIFANGIKRHICDVENSRLRHDLHISVKDRVISPFHEGFIWRNFAYGKFHENKNLDMQSFTKIKPSQNFPNLQ